ncbi:undecaprenyl-phosphate alpha-N-acetylglucosaminyl 1-phosphate transferase [Pseudoalteromonas sp. CO342X]|uniref:UDP-N-acetylglucosamine--undecaprenyl-phosphate N-acetylglucosaminephosphotransferase n=1 Tax=Pseudoalteromonas sp. CO342X TaxID=1777270 RepID=UPI001023155E|nr:UDP-N-acetylglucosamine--undecaprenyl-phosphate N-acetylglucosaminephosphotransferase [Pseudoalteromonas sp. CO342X]RZG14241.1 undecaprenyl-phosphate alpha-N-acetylglucosaminyl 1-phosphate transferase [Pseudoalteromonas sp. CO342X]
MFVELCFVTFFSFTTLFLMRKVAKRTGLVDVPCERKVHQGSIPLAGGISVCVSVSYFLLSRADSFPNLTVLSVSLILLTTLGALDDKYDLSVKVRIAFQACIAAAMIYFTQYQIFSLGNLFGFGGIELGAIGTIMTVVAVIAAINAFNMVDGIDGLLGGLSIVTFASLALLGFVYGDRLTTAISLIFVFAIIPYVLMNLGLLGRERKVFMGDAGSMMIGFAVVWLLLSVSQTAGTASESVRPVTAIWLIAIPLMDMTAIMIRRIRRGDSPFKPDREHLHHIFQKLGFTSIQTLAVIVAISAILALIGIGGELLNIPEYVMFYAFVLLFIGYHQVLSKISAVSLFINNTFGTQLNVENVKA